MVEDALFALEDASINNRSPLASRSVKRGATSYWRRRDMLEAETEKEKRRREENKRPTPSIWAPVHHDVSKILDSEEGRGKEFSVNYNDDISVQLFWKAIFHLVKQLGAIKSELGIYTADLEMKEEY